MDDGLKQRLVGALVLTAAAVIFLPVLFNREVRRPLDATSQIPPAPGLVPLETREPVRPQGIVPAKDPEEMFQPKEPEPERPVQKRLDPQGIPVSWVVQVASFTSTARADKLRERLLADGYKAYTRQVNTAKGPAVRVFVGPKIDKASAMAVKQELDKALDVETLVLRFRP
ncbi:succinate dehydrogenase [Exilibacterium tricleocarpae]|uniref:Succinate dehydrogenase n=1 Tax=Exilibacterium tricleocarpae TaxID=2591008 RepID=A0A545SRV8_9GAMM|nr:SPOR domain-containing protein [Exilibacterium tricleocarpae]TQV67697.1 succinate dehydrogenase [Exilibacterium tricleocarpae]